MDGFGLFAGYGSLLRQRGKDQNKHWDKRGGRGAASVRATPRQRVSYEDYRGLWSSFKRGMSGTFDKISKKYLPL